MTFPKEIDSEKVKVLLDQQNKEAYHAWVKLTGREDITYDEFSRLKNHGILNSPNHD